MTFYVYFFSYCIRRRNSFFISDESSHGRRIQIVITQNRLIYGNFSFYYIRRRNDFLFLTNLLMVEGYKFLSAKINCFMEIFDETFYDNGLPCNQDLYCLVALVLLRRSIEDRVG